MKLALFFPSLPCWVLLGNVERPSEEQEAQSLWLKPKAGSVYTSSYSERRAGTTTLRTPRFWGHRNHDCGQLNLYQRKGPRAVLLCTLSVSTTGGRGDKEEKEKAKKNGNQAEGNLFRNALSLRLKGLMNPTAEANSELLFSLNAHIPVSLLSPEQLTHLSFCRTISSDHKAHSSCLPSSSLPHFTSLSLTTQLFSLSQSFVFPNSHPECSCKSGASASGQPSAYTPTVPGACVAFRQ